MGKVPEGALQFIRTYRGFKYQETLYELLAKQYELARLDESRDYAPVQVLDHAVAPDKRSKPHRLLIIALSTLAGLVVGCWLSLVQESRKQHAASGFHRQRWELIKSYWRSGARQ
jgi:tyrosine-protein kinase Etk/Wzc